MPEAARKAEAQEAHLLAQETAPRKQRGTVQIRLGMVEDGRGRNQQAERWFARACRHKCYRKVGWLWVLRGANLARAERFRLAEKCYRHALTLPEVDLDEAYRNLGYVLRAQGRYREAQAPFRRSIRLDRSCQKTKEALAGLDGMAFALRESRR